jgi:microcin C transport system substrate-binding protein
VSYGKPFLSYWGDVKHDPYGPLPHQGILQKEGIIRHGIVGTFNSINPWSAKGATPPGLIHISEELVYERLGERSWDDFYTIYSRVAQDFEYSLVDRSLTITINPQARWSSGKLINAQDFLKGIIYLAQKGPIPHQLLLKKVDQIKILDKNRLIFYIKKDIIPLKEIIFSLSMLPVLHVMEDGTLEGSGPYKILNVSLGRHITFLRREDYWDMKKQGSRYPMPMISYDFFKDTSGAIQAISKGDIHTLYPVSEKYWHFLRNRDFQKSNLLSFYERPHNRPVLVKFLGFNTRLKKFKDIYLRKALALIFPQDGILKKNFDYTHAPITSFFENGPLKRKEKLSSGAREILLKLGHSFDEEPFYEPGGGDQDPNIRREKLKKIHQLLKKAGYTFKDHKWIGSQGNPLTLSVMVCNHQDESYCLDFKKALKNLCIDLRIHFVDDAQYFKRLKNFNFETAVMAWYNTLSPGLDQSFHWSSAEVNKMGGSNYIGVNNPLIDQLCHIIGSTEDRSALESHVEALDHLLIKNYYGIPFFYQRFDRIVMRKNVVIPWDKPSIPPLTVSGVFIKSHKK